MRIKWRHNTFHVEIGPGLSVFQVFPIGCWPDLDEAFDQKIIVAGMKSVDVG
jgi:hypothetical protein